MKIPELSVALKNAFPEGKYSGRGWGKFPILKEQIENAVVGDMSTFKEKIYALLSGQYLKPKCYCGGATTLISTNQGFTKFCSAKCSANSSDTKLVRETTNNKKFGVSNPFQNQEIKDKIIKTNLSRYGTSTASKNEKVKLKTKTTLRERYGVDNAAQATETKLKTKNTNLMRYGVECSLQSSESKLKIKTSNLEKYGVEYTLQNLEIRQQIETTNLEKYGAKYYVATKQGIENNKIKLLQRYKREILPIRLKQLEEINIYPVDWSIEDYTDQTKKYNFRCNSCSTVFAGIFCDGSVPGCPKCSAQRSKIEIKLEEELRTYFPDLIICDRKKIAPFEIDILIGGVGIEVNGAWWHTDLKGGTPLYKKTLLAQEAEIQMLHFWDYELISNFELCKSMILSKLGRYESKIFARKCLVKELTVSEARVFFEVNHIQGFVAGSDYIGLEIDGEIVQAMILGYCRFNKDADLELIRLASKINIQIIGGAQKLFSHIKKKYPAKILISYADLRYSNGGVYERLGFTLTGVSKPNYIWKKGELMLSRYKTQKHKLSKLLGDKFNPNLSEFTNLVNNGFLKLSDCGNKVYKTVL